MAVEKKNISKENCVIQLRKAGKIPNRRGKKLKMDTEWLNNEK